MNEKYETHFKLLKSLSEDYRENHHHLKEVINDYQSLYQNYDQFKKFLESLPKQYPTIMSETERLVMKEEQDKLMKVVREIREDVNQEFSSPTKKEENKIVETPSTKIQNRKIFGIFKQPSLSLSAKEISFRPRKKTTLVKPHGEFSSAIDLS